jgi:hypothetical protein
VGNNEGNVGVPTGKTVEVLLANHTGHLKKYRWSATQNGAVIRSGEKALANGHASAIRISTRGTRVGKLRITLDGSDVFVTVSITKSGL